MVNRARASRGQKQFANFRKTVKWTKNQTNKKISKTFLKKPVFYKLYQLVLVDADDSNSEV